MKMLRIGHLWSFPLLLAGVLTFLPTRIFSVTFTVTTGADGPVGSLRWAVNSATNGDEITFAVLGVVALTNSIDLRTDLTIRGPGASLLTVRGDVGKLNPEGMIHVASGIVTISGITIQATVNGPSSIAQGGGVNNAGNLTLNDCVIAGCNILLPGYGGGIFNSGVLVLNRCRISGNRIHEGEGGGIYSTGGSIIATECEISNHRNEGGAGIWIEAGTLELNQCLVTGNNSFFGGFPANGGGIANKGTAVLRNTTVSGNTAYGFSRGGGIWSSGPLTLIGCTIANNTAGQQIDNPPDQGGGVWGNVTSFNSILASNTTSGGNGPDLSGILNSQGFNLIQNTNGFTVSGVTRGNLLGVNPLLGPLEDNGGTTRTHSLLTGSPALDQGSCGTLLLDQRGVRRPQNQPNLPNADDGCDIGAFEQAAQWFSRYAGPGGLHDQASAMCIDSNGNIYVAGFIQIERTNTDIVLIKFNTADELVWDRVYDGGSHRSDRPTSMALDSAGNVYIAAESDGINGKSDFLTLKYAPNGTLLWAIRYDGPVHGYDIPAKIKVDTSGNVVVAGSSQTTNRFEIAIVKYRPTGTLNWEARYGGTPDQDTSAAGLALDAANNVYVAGTSSSGSVAEFLTVKYSAQGIFQWFATHRGIGSQSHARDIATDSAGNIVVTGDSMEDSASGVDLTTISYSPAGANRWISRWQRPGGGDERPVSLIIDGRDVIYIAGQSVRSGNSDFVAIKLSPSGTLAWATSYSGPANGYDAAAALALDDLSHVYVSGPSSGSDGGLDFCTAQLDAATGAQLEVQRFNPFSTGRNCPTALAVDRNGAVYVAGWAEGPLGDLDLMAVKHLFASNTPIFIGVAVPRLSVTLTNRNGQAAVRLTALPGQRVSLQESPDLKAWTTVQVLVDGAMVDVNIPIEGARPQRFFRLISAP